MFLIISFRNLVEISANNHIFHRYETKNPLFDFKIECGSSHHCARWFGVGFSLEKKFGEVIVVLSNIAHCAADRPGLGDS